MIKKLLAGISGGLLLTLSVPMVALAANSVKVVTPANQQGWMFNRDITSMTPYQFTEEESSRGDGSLEVLPIGLNPRDKFIAEKSLGIPTEELDSISYDFMISGNGDAEDANQFYLNVYTNLPGSTTFYDCRYDYTPSTGSTTNFTTASFSTTDTPVFVRERVAGTCPDTLAEMPSGSIVSFFSINVGDTSSSDAGLAGYLDNVVVKTSGGTTIYDFELTNQPKSKDNCKKDGYKNMTDATGNAFKNQGQCVSYANHNSRN